MSERGVKETKEVLAFVFSFANAMKVSLSDGDFDFWDAKNFVEPLKKLAPAVENIDEVIIDIGSVKGESEPIIVHSKNNKSKIEKTSAA